MSINANLRTARRDFDDFVAWCQDIVASMSLGHQVLLVCILCLALFWLTTLRPGRPEREGKKADGRPFQMALAVVVIFGLGAGYWLSQNAAVLGGLLS
ncbi:MAG: hypothetical protein AAGH87_01445 [Pseudomonadota bacterium]